MNRCRRTRPPGARAGRAGRVASPAVLAALVISGLALAPAGATPAAPAAATPAAPAGATAARPAATTAARPAAAPSTQDETWLGRIQRDGRGYAYVGRACPEQAEICYDIVANYRIVALNPTAARAVRRLSGGQARLHGHLGPGQDGGHNGTLFVTRAERPRGGAARTVQPSDASNARPSP